jgi:lysophospholipase L1-like esterase
VYTGGLDPEAQDYVERILRFMNGRGAAPVIVLTPINPKLLAEVEPLGWRERYGQVLAYLESLRPEYDFALVDITDPASFGADPMEYHDGVHLTSANTRRAIDHVLEQTGGVPR